MCNEGTRSVQKREVRIAQAPTTRGGPFERNFIIAGGQSDCEVIFITGEVDLAAHRRADHHGRVRGNCAGNVIAGGWWCGPASTSATSGAAAGSCTGKCEDRLSQIEHVGAHIGIVRVDNAVVGGFIINKPVTGLDQQACDLAWAQGSAKFLLGKLLGQCHHACHMRRGLAGAGRRRGPTAGRCTVDLRTGCKNRRYHRRALREERDVVDARSRPADRAYCDCIWIARQRAGPFNLKIRIGVAGSDNGCHAELVGQRTQLVAIDRVGLDKVAIGGIPQRHVHSDNVQGFGMLHDPLQGFLDPQAGAKTGSIERLQGDDIGTGCDAGECKRRGGNNGRDVGAMSFFIVRGAIPFIRKIAAEDDAIRNPVAIHVWPECRMVEVDPGIDHDNRLSRPVNAGKARIALEG